jgi:hypothetical protein
MAENAVQSVQSLIQDVLAPDVRELKVRVESLEKRMDERFASFEKRMDERFAAERAHNDANIQMILGAIKRLELVSENSALRAVADVRERVAILEARAA